MSNIGIDNPALESEIPEASNGIGLELSDYKAKDNEGRNGEAKLKIDHDDDVEDERLTDKGSILGTVIEKIRTAIFTWIVKNKKVAVATTLIIIFLLFNAYLAATIWYAVTNKKPIDWRNGLGLLVIITALAYFGMFYFLIVKRIYGRRIYKNFLKPYILRPVKWMWSFRPVTWVVYVVIIAGVLTFLIIDSRHDYDRLRSLAGIVVFVFIGFLLSTHPGKIKWRQVFWGLALQFIFALMTLRWNTGKEILNTLGDKVKTFLAFTDSGSSMVYGFLVNEKNNVFAFRSLSTIFFFSFFIQILYYYGIMQWVIKKLSWLLQVTMGTTACESMNAAANIFVGQTEAPILIKPYLSLMTKSEIHAVMTGGFATIAGTVMASYINFGIDASHLLTASIMGAPAALGMAKLYYPETKKSKTTTKDIVMTRGTEANVLDAAAQGASTAISLVLNIIANLIAFLAFITFLNAVFSWFGGLLGASYISFEWLLAKVFIPVAWLLGVPPAECDKVALLLGLKTVVNEFVAYQQLAEMKAKKIISERAEVIATYALCGFANPGSIGIQLGGMSAMCPERKSEFANIVMRAFVAGTFSCFLNACIAGMLIN